MSNTRISASSEADRAYPWMSRIVPLGEDADESAVVDDNKRTDIAICHSLDRFADRGIGSDRVNIAALMPEQVGSH